MICRLNVYSGASGLTFERGETLLVVFTALTARRVEFDDDTIHLLDHRGRALGPFTAGGLVIAARRRYYRLRVWYDQVDAQPPDYYRLWREQTERAHALEGEQARLVRVCEAIVVAYNTLYAEMDSEYAAHFTALGSVVQFAGKAVGKEVAGG